MPIARIRCEESAAPKTQKHKTFNSVVPASGPYKGQPVKVFKIGCSGFFGYLANGTEVYIFHSELKEVKRIK